MRSLVGMRTRWAAIGAACAVALGAGGFGVVNAVVTSGSKGTYVPVTPTRVLDTRNTQEISGTTHRLVIEGVVSLPDGTTRQVVPTDATAVSINLTVTNGRKNDGYGYVTAFDCLTDSDPIPDASAINFENRIDIANALNIATSSNGSICLYVYGTADLIVDVNGYFVDHNHDDRYYTEAETNTLIDNTLYFGTTGAFTNAFSRFNTSPDYLLPGQIAVDSDGNPFIVYRKSGTAKPWITYCMNPLCTRATHRELDANNRGSNGKYSVALASDGTPTIVYRTNVDGAFFAKELRLVRCVTDFCQTSTSTVLSQLASDGPVVMTTNASGFPVIGYFGYEDATARTSNTQTLRMITCQDPACGTYSDTTIATTNYKTYLSLMIGPGGYPRFGFGGYQSVKFLACSDSTCSNPASPATLTDPLSSAGTFVFGHIRSDGRPVIYGASKVFDCSDATCSSSTSSDHQLGTIVAAAVSSDGQIYFAKSGTYGSEPFFEVTQCNEPSCSTPFSAVLESGPGQLVPASIAFGHDGNPVFSYAVRYMLGFARWAVVEPT